MKDKCYTVQHSAVQYSTSMVRGKNLKKILIVVHTFGGGWGESAEVWTKSIL